MSRRARIIFGIVGVLIVALFITWRFVRYAFYVERAQHNDVDPSTWEILRAHPDDPRTMAAAVFALHWAGMANECEAYDRLKDTAEPFFATHPTSDDGSLEAIAQIVRQCPDRRALKWTKRPSADVVMALHKDIKD